MDIMLFLVAIIWMSLLLGAVMYVDDQTDERTTERRDTKMLG